MVHKWRILTEDGTQVGVRLRDPGRVAQVGGRARDKESIEDVLRRCFRVYPSSDGSGAVQVRVVQKSFVRYCFDASWSQVRVAIGRAKGYGAIVEKLPALGRWVMG